MRRPRILALAATAVFLIAPVALAGPRGHHHHRRSWTPVHCGPVYYGAYDGFGVRVIVADAGRLRSHARHLYFGDRGPHRHGRWHGRHQPGPRRYLRHRDGAGPRRPRRSPR